MSDVAELRRYMRVIHDALENAKLEPKILRKTNVLHVPHPSKLNEIWDVISANPHETIQAMPQLKAKRTRQVVVIHFERKPDVRTVAQVLQEIRAARSVRVKRRPTRGGRGRVQKRPKTW